MKKFIAIIVLAIVVFTSSTAYAGDAWPWIVGGLAGAALLTSVAHANNRTTTHVYHQPSYYPTYTSYAYPASYSSRVWVSGYYDSFGIWHDGYYTYRNVYAY